MPGDGHNYAVTGNAAPSRGDEHPSFRSSRLSGVEDDDLINDGSPEAAQSAPDSGTAPLAKRKRKATNAPSRGVANLTPEQLAKKRANDREAQRAIRERTKAQIEALQQQVRDLSSQKPYLDLQVALKEKEAVEAENREIKKRLAEVLDILQPLLRTSGISNPPATFSQHELRPPLQPPAPSESNGCTPSSVGSLPAGQPHIQSTTSARTPSPIDQLSTLVGLRRSWPNNGVEQPWPIPTALNYQRHNLTHGLDFGESGERLGFNFLLDGSEQIPKVNDVRLTPDSPGPPQTTTASPGDPQLANNLSAESPLTAFTAPIQNVPPTCPLDSVLLNFLRDRQRQAAEGVSRQRLVGPPYPSITSLLNPEKSVYSHPISKVFTDVLRTFPDIASLPEQVAVLYVMFLLMRWQIYPTQQNYERLPEWLTPRPSQLLTPHPAWVDYIPWPRLRDRLVMSWQSYPFDEWFVPWTRTISVNWPYEATDCLLSSPDSEELLINPVFERHLRNLNNWSLGKEWADLYPGLADAARVKHEPSGYLSSQRSSDG
ncbi:hypothetical protein DTO021D3_5095 [Paecilomyces variotii]|nr:hypothetical protein DTO032I3_6797 [Paecilomyces variotii]KAJ9278128.1 hypothetical protein DTO021D3_5095 [Paecilomyces variotii]KAJ9345783.1 hypothetical protein DTO027B6_1743 [Paecilomyces variotii]KAJ9387369.1 hypothetical protein DTO032I4_3233 [Paecilomyces variotii]KAJ9411601.1 hypothetical protein DTO045G8_508 [Paecilomyces variotii]